LTFDGSNLGLGVTPSAWSAGKGIEVGFAGNAVYSYSQTDFEILSNAYYNSGYKFGGTGRAMMYAMGTAGSGIHSWHTSTASGAAGGTISFTQAMTLDASGRLGIGSTSPAKKLQLDGGNSYTAAMRLSYGTDAPPYYVDWGYKSNGDGNKVFLTITDNGSAKDVLVANYNGNVGIGTSLPASYARLSVSGTAGDQTAANQQIVINAPTTTAGQGAGIRFNAASGAKEAVSIIGVVNEASGNAGAMTFHVYDLGPVIPERMRLDSAGNLGLGVTPSAWFSVHKTFQLGGTFSGVTRAGALTSQSNDTVVQLFNNAYVNTSAVETYFADGEAAKYKQNRNSHEWHTAPSGTAGNPISFTQAMTLTADGNLGIGPTSPGARLDVTTATAGFAASLTNTNGASDSNGLYVKSGTVSTEYNLRLSNTSGSTDFMVVKGNGNVGIGTSSPQASAKLHVYAAGDYTDESAPFTLGSSSTGDMRLYAGVNNTNDYTYIGSVLSGIAYGSLVLQPNGGSLLVGTTSNSRGARLRVEGLETAHFTGYGNGYGIGLWMTPNPSATGGTATPVSFQNVSDATVGSITTTASATAYNTSSDYRLKEDWVAVADASTRVNALKPINFAWKVDGSRVDGFLAHELAEVVPEAVTGEKDAVELVDIKDEGGNVTGQEERPIYQGIDQSKLVPLLTAALQEALAKIESLTARVSALEGN
jgi:hypothetical protein